MKLKGTTVRTREREYVLKDQLGEGGFSMIYETNAADIICKVQVLINPEITKAYTREKQILKSISHPNIVKLYDSYELENKDGKFGMLFMERCSSGTAFDVLEKSQGVDLSEKKILKILSVVADVLQTLHSKGIAHRDIKMQNVLINSLGQYKLCDFGSCSRTVIKNIDSSNRTDIEEYIQKTTTPLYRSPQQIDLYSGYQIGPKVDIFALGVLAFMMCFQKPPFESRLSAINKQYFLPENHSYSKELVNFIINCFTTNPAQRPSATEVKQELKQISQLKRVQIDMNVQKEIHQTLAEIGRITEANLKKNTEVAQTGILDKIKRIYNQITTQTQGWIAGFVEDSEQAPQLKYNREIISKCYEKKYKIEKVYDIIQKYSQDYKTKSLVTLKLLILVHNFLRKGPKEAIIYDKDNSPLKLCMKIYKHWKQSKTTDEQDFKRNPFVCLMIRSYALILIQKIRLCYENSHLIQANYSIAPYLSNIKENTILKLGFISSMLDFLKLCIDFHEQVQRVNYLTQIQKAIVLSLVDEQYCLISTLTFVLSAFKMAICYVREEIDTASLIKQVTQIEKSYEKTFRRLAHLLTHSHKDTSLTLENSNISLNLDAIGYVKNLKIEKRQGKFNVSQHLNYKKSIYGLKIPLTYEQVVRNPDFLKDLEKNNTETNSKIVVEVNQFKVKKETKPEEKRPPPSPKSQTIAPIKSSAGTKSNEHSKKDSKETSPTAFSKPKDAKDKIFQNFSFDQEKKIEPKAPQTSQTNNIMEFTHQNLNKDFLSINTGANTGTYEEKNDKFRDFFSIVQEKFEKEKITKKSPQSAKEANINSNASKEVFTSSTPADINKVELMNFFFDEQEENEKKQPKKTEKKVKSEENFVDLIDLAGTKHQTSIVVPQKQIQQPQTNFIPVEKLYEAPPKQETQSPPRSQSKISIDKNSKKSPTKEENLIDLKEFVVEEVRKNAQQYIIDFSTLIFKDKIGYGNSSQVFKGQWRGRQVAIKKIKDNLSRSEKEFKRQIMTSVKIRHHPQLVTLIGVSQHDKYFYIINQFCNGSTLFDLLHQSSEKLPWKTRINIAKQIARGMIFLHTNDPPIIHRDLKSLNVLLVNQYDQLNPDLIQLKIADFGLSRDYASTYMTGTLGTYHWMAPQIFSNEQYTLKADVYSYGIVLWEIASRVPPYTDMKNPHSLMKFVTMENGRPDMTFVDRECPHEWKMLMTRCWDKFPSNRPTFTQILSCLQYLSN